MGIISGNSAWVDFPSTSTPINAARLNNLEAGVDAHAVHPIVAGPSTSTAPTSWVGKTVVYSGATAVTYTIPSTVPVGARIDFVATGAGMITLAASGMTIVCPKTPVTRVTGSAMTALKVDASTLVVVGDLA